MKEAIMQYLERADERQPRLIYGCLSILPERSEKRLVFSGKGKQPKKRA